MLVQLISLIKASSIEAFLLTYGLKCCNICTINTKHTILYFMNIINRQEAINNKLTHYFTGKTCKNGHIAKRLTKTGACVECKKIHRLKSIEKLGRDRKTIIKYSDLPESTKERYREKCRDRHKKNKYWSQYNYKYNSAIKKRKRRDRLIKTPENIRKINEIYSKVKEGQHVDHIVPLCGENVSGLHVWYNLQIISKEENLKKGNKFDPYEYAINELGMDIDKAKIIFNKKD